MATVLFTLVAYSFTIKAQANSPCLLPWGGVVVVVEARMSGGGGGFASMPAAGRLRSSPVFSDLAPLSSGIWEEGVMKPCIGKLANSSTDQTRVTWGFRRVLGEAQDPASNPITLCPSCFQEGLVSPRRWPRLCVSPCSV